MGKALSNEDRVMIQNSPIVIVADTETTGYSPEKGSSLLEIGAVKLDVQNRKIVGSFSHLIRPMLSSGKVPPKITEITGITTEDVKDAEEQELVMEQFWHFVGAYPIVFHNSSFDWRFLLKAFHGIGVNPVNYILDTLVISRDLNTALTCHKLDALSAYYGHPIEGHHRAVVDAKYTAAIYLRMQEEMSRQTVLGTMPEQKSIMLYDLNYLKILRVKFWESGRRQRIYVTTSAGALFYDIGRGVWSMSEMRLQDVSVECQACGARILELLNMDLETFIQTYRGNAA